MFNINLEDFEEEFVIPINNQALEEIPCKIQIFEKTGKEIGKKQIRITINKDANKKDIQGAYGILKNFYFDKKISITGKIEIGKDASDEYIKIICGIVKNIENLRLAGNFGKVFSVLKHPVACKKLHLTQATDAVFENLYIPGEYLPKLRYVTFSSILLNCSCIQKRKGDIFSTGQILGYEFLGFEDVFSCFFTDSIKLPKFVYQSNMLQELSITVPVSLKEVAELANLTKLKVNISNEFMIKEMREFYAKAPKKLKDLYIEIKCLPTAKHVKKFSSSLQNISKLRNLENLTLEFKLLDMQVFQFYKLIESYKKLPQTKLIISKNLYSKYADVLIKCATPSKVQVNLPKIVEMMQYLETILTQAYANYPYNEKLAVYKAQFLSFKNLYRDAYFQQSQLLFNLANMFIVNWIECLKPLSGLVNISSFSRIQFAIKDSSIKGKNIVLPKPISIKSLFFDESGKKKFACRFKDVAIKQKTVRLIEFCNKKMKQKRMKNKI